MLVVRFLPVRLLQHPNEFLEGEDVEVFEEGAEVRTRLQLRGDVLRLGDEEVLPELHGLDGKRELFGVCEVHDAALLDMHCNSARRIVPTLREVLEELVDVDSVLSIGHGALQQPINQQIVVELAHVHVPVQEKREDHLRTQQFQHENVLLVLAQQIPVMVQQLHRLDHHLVHIAAQQNQNALHERVIAERRGEFRRSGFVGVTRAL